MEAGNEGEYDEEKSRDGEKKERRRNERGWHKGWTRRREKMKEKGSEYLKSIEAGGWLRENERS